MTSLSQGLLVSFVVAGFLLFYASWFLFGLWHEDGRSRFGVFHKFTFFIDPDFVFGKLSTRIVLGADILGFWICILQMLLMLANGLLCHFRQDALNLTGVFLFVGLGGSWIGRIMYILKYKNRGNQIPLLWPGRRF